MTPPFPLGHQSKTDKLVALLLDGQWHSTKELARKVSHAFAGSIWKLRHTGHNIERQRHPKKRYEHQYRLTGGDAA